MCKMTDTEFAPPISQSTTEINDTCPTIVEEIGTNTLQAEEGAVGQIDYAQQDITALASEVKLAPRTVSRRHQSRILEMSVYIVLATGASMFLGEYM
jgi:hypothetical protein